MKRLTAKSAKDAKKNSRMTTNVVIIGIIGNQMQIIGKYIKFLIYPFRVFRAFRGQLILSTCAIGIEREKIDREKREKREKKPE